MNHDTEKKGPDKKHQQLTEEDFGYDSWFSLVDALQKPGVSVGALTTFIEKKGIKTFDQVGRFITATDGGKREPTSKAHALNLLALYYKELRDCADLPPRAHPPQDPDRWLEYESPLNEFGWPKDEVPDDPDGFAKWISNPIPEEKEILPGKIKDTDPNDLKEQATQIPDTFPLEQAKLQTSNSQNAETPQPITNWRMRIQAEAAIIWCKQKKVGCSPTKLSINAELAKWCRDNNVTTDYGIWPSENYIYRHVTRLWEPPSC